MSHVVSLLSSKLCSLDVSPRSNKPVGASRALGECDGKHSTAVCFCFGCTVCIVTYFILS